MVGTGAYLWRRNIPMSLKVIHARMVAQAGVIGGLCCAGAYSIFSESGKAATPKASVVDHNRFRQTVVKAKAVPVAPAATSSTTAAAAPIQE